MTKLFNGSFELSLRVLLLISESEGAGMTLDRIFAYDFMTIYSRDFEISDTSLHGVNEFRFSEFATKRPLVQDALTSLVLAGLINVLRENDGFHYSISENGKTLCQNITAEYATAYRSLAKKVMQKYDSMTEVTMLNLIHKESAKALRR